MHERFVVLGSNSFSGSHFVEFLLRQNHPVLGISRSSEPHPVFLPYKDVDNHPRLFEFFKGDLNRDHSDIVSRVADFSPDYIVNFAAQGMVVGDVAVGIALKLGRQTKQLQQRIGAKRPDRDHMLIGEI